MFKNKKYTLKQEISDIKYWLNNLFIMLRSIIYVRIFKKEYDKSIIPEGQYCYTPDFEKNESEPDSMKNNGFTYYTKPCLYYRTLGNRYNGCQYLGIITDDLTFDDQCKICCENDE
jgi:hypothetical protein